MKVLIKKIFEKLDLFIYIASNVILKILSGITMIFVARYFTPTDYGTFRTLIAFLTLTGILINLGLSDFFLYKASKTNPEKEIVHIISIYLLLYSLTFIPACFLFSIVYKLSWIFFAIGYLKIFFDWSYDIILKSLQAKNNFNLASIITIINALIIGMPVLCLYKCNLSLFHYIASVVFFAGLNFTFAFLIFKLKYKIIFKKVQRNFWEIVGKASPFFIASIMVFVYLQSDVLMLGFLRELKEVAFYTSATALIFALYVLPTSVYNYFLPSLIKNSKNKKKFLQEQNIFILAIFSLVIPIFLVIFFYARPILHIIYSGKYDSSTLILKILSLGFFMHGFSFVAGASLTALGFQSIRAKMQVFAAVLNILLNIYFIPIYGALGTAITTFITEIFLAVSYVYATIKIEHKLFANN